MAFRNNSLHTKREVKYASLSIFRQKYVFQRAIFRRMIAMHLAELMQHLDQNLKYMSFILHCIKITCLHYTIAFDESLRV